MFMDHTQKDVVIRFPLEISVLPLPSLRCAI